MTRALVNPQTGEIDADAVLERALDYVLLLADLEDRAAELDHDRKRAQRLADELLGTMALGESIDAGAATLVRTGPPRPVQRVSRSGCEAWFEELMDLGLGKLAYQPPG